MTAPIHEIARILRKRASRLRHAANTQINETIQTPGQQHSGWQLYGKLVYAAAQLELFALDLDDAYPELPKE